ncbi:hypothetical protein BDEG_28307 [Batrachochytrium dendrobatidis JEL423]|uniref:Peptidase A1 domain-containing protein n=1 Tax=Batrachochytrium dendrobatidis (strain JEL423) TaxID=403673 RepID=A0A177WYV6_BATDL|nr:hypothetical protein BDEG_28307 [Batrachochytrium dendrobatidis JEL423]
MSDIVVPLPSSSNDIGLAIQSISSGEPVTIKYKGKEYNGVTSTATVTIPGTSITDINLPVVAAERQSADSVGIGGKLGQGMFGFAYSSLSNHHSQTTAMDTLYSNNVIPRNEISIQLCPYEMLSDSFINIGSTDITPKCGTDGSSVAWVSSPSNDRHTVNIKNILVNGKKVKLPEEFQKRVKDGRTLYSSVETCFLHMRFPKAVVKALIDAIINSDGITIKYNGFRNNYLDKRMIKNRLKENRLMARYKYDIDWSRMPSFTIVMFAENPVTDDNRDSVVEIRLGPRDYMQRVSIRNSEKFWFTVTAGSNDYAVLGMSFMTRLTLTFDRTHKRIGFGPGCGCETATNEYPTISNDDQVLWPLTQLPEEPSTSIPDLASTLRRSFSRLSSTIRDSRRPKMDYDQLDG